MNIYPFAASGAKLGYLWKRYLLLGCLSLLLSLILQPSLSSQALETMEISGEPVTVVAQVEQPEDLYRWIATATDMEETKHRLLLTLEGLEYDRPANLFYEVYLNLPLNPDNGDLRLHYVGNLALYAFPQGGNYQFEIFDEVQRLVRQGRLKDLNSVTVTFVPASLQGVTTFKAPPIIRFRRLIISRNDSHL